MHLPTALGVCLVTLGTCLIAQADPSPAPEGYIAVRNLDYSGQDNPRQKLDLYLPEKPPGKLLPLIAYVHGGGWEGGTKDDAGVTLHFIKQGGYAGASIGYRLTNEAHWPSQVYDVKAALRWLKAHSKDHGIDPDRIALFGISAGGHLVSLLGTSYGVKELEGDVGKSGDTVRPVCVANFCGPANFLTFYGKGSSIDADRPGSAIAKLFGGPMSKHLEEARSASPVTYVTKDDPPFLHMHGTADSLVPYAQAEEFDAALDKAGVSSTLLTGKDAPHVFFSKDLIDKMQTFFDKHLQGKPGEVKQGPVAAK
ncbi:MAG: alpha/beta hydrolase [Verrucomicrobiota bacterium]